MGSTDDWWVGREVVAQGCTEASRSAGRHPGRLYKDLTARGSDWGVLVTAQ